MASTFDQRYPDFLVGHYTRYMAVGTLLPGFSTIDKWFWAGMFGTLHKLYRDINNDRTQLLS